MVSKATKIVNEQGLHVRPAGELVKEMSKFSSEINLVVNGNKINAKSVLNIMAACIKFGMDVTVEAEGDDAEAAVAKAVEMIESGFGE